MGGGGFLPIILSLPTHAEVELGCIKVLKISVHIFGGGGPFPPIIMSLPTHVEVEFIILSWKKT